MFEPKTERLQRRRLGRVAPLVAGLVLGAGAIAGAAIAFDDDDGGGATRTVTATETEPASLTAVQDGALLGVEDLYREASPGVVLIESGEGLGSGFVIDEEGSIVTNQHVVAGAQELTVTFDDETQAPARVLGTDPGSDLALLDVDVPADELDPLPLGDLENVAVGEPVVAIGNPFGLERTITAGIVSALGRRIEAPDGFAIDGAIQTDAALNSGNSGGPLLDLEGNVIGVNSQIETRSGGNVGIGYAVPVDTLKDVLEDLRQGGEVERAYLGISMQEEDDGVTVAEVRPDSPAAAAGLEQGDVIVSVDGEEVQSADDVSAQVSAKEPGEEVELEIERGGETQTVTATLGDRPASAETP